MVAELQVRVDSAEFRRVMAQAKSFDRRLYLQLRRRLRAASRPVVTDVQQHLLRGGASKTGLRAGLAAGTRATVSTGRAAGVTITTSPSKLPPSKRAMAKTWNKSVFRHRVFGEDVWRSQAGNPTTPVILHQRLRFQQAVVAALQDTLRQMETTR
jgi:hypothetical protein